MKLDNSLLDRGFAWKFKVAKTSLRAKIQNTNFLWPLYVHNNMYVCQAKQTSIDLNTYLK